MLVRVGMRAQIARLTLRQLSYKRECKEIGDWVGRSTLKQKIGFNRDAIRSGG